MKRKYHESATQGKCTTMNIIKMYVKQLMDIDNVFIGELIHRNIDIATVTSLNILDP